MKRILTKLAILTLALVHFFGSNAVAENRKGTFTLTPLVGYRMIDGGLEVDDGTVYGLGVGYNITQHWALETDVTYLPTETEQNSLDVDIWSVSLNMLYDFQPDKVVHPYLLIGGGGMIYDFDDSSYDQEDFMANWGGGFRYAMNDTIALRVDLRHIMTYRKDNELILHSDAPNWRHHIQIMAGLTFQFGQPRPTLKVQSPILKNELDLVQKPTEDQTIKSVDSDNDTVIDADDQCPGTAPGVRVDTNGCPADTDKDGVPDYQDGCIETPTGTKVDAKGCPLGTEPVATLIMRLNFGFDKATVTPFHFSELQKAVNFISQYPNHKIEVQGHTDNVGDEEYNLNLSLRRAENVKKVLIQRYGINKQRITATGLGASQPLNDNDTEEGRGKNRRVEIDILP